jgi:signal transduction histidine kinase
MMMKTAPGVLETVHAVTERLATVDDVNTALKDVLRVCAQALQAQGGTIYLHNPARRQLDFVHVVPEDVAPALSRLHLPDDLGVAGRVFQTGEYKISAFSDADKRTRTFAEQTGIQVRSMITMPLMIQGLPPIGVIQLVNRAEGDFDQEDAALMEIVSDVVAMAVINQRLLEQRARVASLEGMGRAAHDLANKAGVLMTFLPDFQRSLDGLRGVLKLQGVRGEALLYLDMLEGTYKDIFSPYSERVYRYARLVNDLAAGKRLSPKMREQSFGRVVQEAMEFTEPQARRARITLESDIDFQAPDFAFDDLFVIRIVENLIGNAIKAVSDTAPPEWMAEGDEPIGKILVHTSCEDGVHSLVVSDSGPGLSPGQIREILSGQARSQWLQSSGTGLGTKIIMEMAEAHGAKVGIDSRLGEGATFRVDFMAN